MCDQCEFMAGRQDVAQAEAEWEVAWRRRSRATIGRNGFEIIMVDGGLVQFAYTNGLWLTRGCPELVVVGLQPDVGYALLQGIGEMVRDRGVTPSDGYLLETGWRTVLFSTFPDPGRVVAQTNAYLELPPAESVPAFQVIYPDVHGVWPWHPGCHLFPGQQELHDGDV